MNIPEEVLWIQHLLDTVGVTGTLRLISVNCADRAGLPGTHPARWAELAEIVAAAAQQTQRLEPERIVRDD